MLVAAVAAPVAAPTGDPQTSRIVTDGFIGSTRRYGKNILVNGSFSRIGFFTGSALGLNTSGARQSGFPAFDGMVSVSVADGEGGWYVGGDFAHIGTDRRRGLAHLGADGSLQLDVPTVNGRVYALTLVDQVLYVGGDFTAVGGTKRNNLAAVSVADGDVLPFAPDPAGYVSELAYAPALGERSARVFASLGNPGEVKLRSYEADTAMHTPGFTPGTVDGSGGELLVAGTGLYVGTHGVTRLDATTGARDLTFRTHANGRNTVSTMLLDGDVLYVGGSMHSVSGQSGALIALDAATGVAEPAFRPRIEGLGSRFEDRGVLDLSLDGAAGELWVAGAFTRVGGTDASNLAVLDPGTGSRLKRTLPWLDDQVNAVDLSGDQVLIGGYFYMADALAAKGLATLDGASLEPLSGSTFRVPPSFQSMVPQGDTIFLADTNNRGPDKPRYGQPYYNYSSSVVAVDATTGRRKPDLGLDRIKNLVAVTAAKGRLYAVRRLGNTMFPRNEVAVFSATTGRVKRIFEVPLRGYVTEIKRDGNGLLLAGSFKRKRPSGQRANLAVLRLRPNGKLDERFDPFLNGPVYDMSDGPGPLFLTGPFKKYMSRDPHVGLARTGSERYGFVDNRFQASAPWSPGRHIYVLGNAVALSGNGTTFYDKDTGARLPDPTEGLAESVSAVVPLPGGRFAATASTYYQNLGGQGFVRLEFLQAFG